MPEGDILRRTAATLEAAFTGQLLLRTELRWPGVGGTDLAGRTVLGTEAYGKHLFTRLDDGHSLHTHLRMEGSWSVLPPTSGQLERSLRDPFVRAVLVCEPWAAVGHRLGMLDLLRTRDEHTLIGHLGPDVLATTFPATGLPEALARLAAQPRVPVAEALLDQRVVAGLGTIYTAESLFVRRLWPWTPVEDLQDPATLLMTAHRLMERSVTSQVPTTTGDGGRGMTSWVHGRAGRPCRRCGTAIRVGQARQPPQQRPVFYCPVCQPERQGRAVSRRA